MKPISSEDIHLINANLLLTDETNVAFKVHKQLINSLNYYLYKFKISKNKQTN